MDTKKKIIKILEEITESCGFESLEDTDLFDEGILDSLSFLEVIIKFDEIFGVKVEPTELERSDINTLNKMVEVVNSRL